MSRMLLVLAVALVPGCKDDLHGTLEVDYGDQTVRFEPSSCNSGEELAFFGVELWDDDADNVLVFAHEPTQGPRLGFWRGSNWENVTELIPEEDCSLFSGELKRIAPDAEEVAVMRGSLELDCTTPDATRVHGALSFDDCSSLEARDEDR